MAKIAKLDRQVWLHDNAWKATLALRQLQQAKKQRNCDFDDRIRALRAFSEKLFVKAADTQLTDLFEVDEMLSPEINKLLEAPLHGLT